MSLLLAKIDQDIRKYIKQKKSSQDQLKLDALRLLKSEIQYDQGKRKKKSGAQLTDEEIQGIVKRGVKKRRESILAFEKGNRPKAVAEEQVGLELLESLLPAAVTPEEIARAIATMMTQLKTNDGGQDDATQKRELQKRRGQLMGMIMKEFQKKNIDGQLVRKMVDRALDLSDNSTKSR